jgi:hypothetical protein
MGGQFWVGGWYYGSPSFVSFFTEVCGLALSDDMAARATAYAGTVESACWWWPHKDFVMVCERPTHIDRDESGRLHSMSRCAIAWPDGYRLAFVHGLRVPEDVVEHPENLSVSRIDGEANAEIRRVMVELYGRERYLRDSGAKLVDESVDALGQPLRLWRRQWPDGRVIQCVEVANSTVEPDGSRRAFFLGVHPECRPILNDAGSLGEPQALTAINAVASLVGMRGEEYRPMVET